MKFERVDDKTVKCFLTNEELEEYDIDYKDFVVQSDKARELTHEILQQAHEQVGYQPSKFAFEMQIMVVPDQGMMLTLTDGGDSRTLTPVQQLLMYLEGLKVALGQMKRLPELPPSEPDAEGQGALPSLPQQENHPTQGVFAFQTMNELMSFAAVMPNHSRLDTRLYKMDDEYFLYLAKGSASYERFSRACVQAMEFSDLCGAGEEPLKALEEHGTCLIAEKALNKLHF